MVMLHRIKTKRFIALVAISIVLVINAYASNKDTLVIGKISLEKNKSDHAALTQLAETAMQDMSIEGMDKTDVYIAKTMTEMIAALKSGKIDWVSDSLFTSLLLAENIQAEVFLSKSRVVKKHSTVLFARKDSTAKSFNNLEKKIILFPDATSTNGYFVPFYELAHKGYIMRVYGKGDGKEGGEKKLIFYRFEKDSSKTIKDVLNNSLNIGVMTDESYDKIPAETKKRLKVVYKSVAYPETLELIRPDLDVDIKEKLRQVLTKKRVTEKESGLVQKKDDARRFERFIASGKDGYVFLRNIIKHKLVPIDPDK